MAKHTTHNKREKNDALMHTYKINIMSFKIIISSSFLASSFCSPTNEQVNVRVTAAVQNIEKIPSNVIRGNVEIE